MATELRLFANELWKHIWPLFILALEMIVFKLTFSYLAGYDPDVYLYIMFLLVILIIDGRVRHGDV